MDEYNWLKQLKVGNKVDYKTKNVYTTATVTKIHEPNLIYIRELRYDSSDESTDSSSDNENIIYSFWRDIRLDIRDKQHLKQIAPFNTFSIPLIICAKTKNNSIHNIRALYFKCNNYIIKINEKVVDEYNMDTDTWKHIIVKTSELKLRNMKYYPAIFMATKSKVYLLKIKKDRKIKCIEYDINLHVFTEIIVENAEFIRSNNVNIEEQKSYNSDSSQSSSSYFSMKPIDNVFYSCYVPSMSAIFIVNKRNQLIKFTLDTKHSNIQRGTFEMLTEKLDFILHSNLLYSESLDILITFESTHVITVFYCSLNDYKWKQCETKIDIDSEFISTIIYGHIIILFSNEAVLLFDMLFDTCIKLDKDFYPIPIMSSMKAINYNDKYIHLIQKYRDYLFGPDFVPHVKFAVCDLVSISMQQLYKQRTELLCVGYIFQQKYSMNIPAEIVALVASFFSYFM